MKDIHIVYGSTVYDFFVLPTIVITTTEGSYRFVTIQWMYWYFGFAWD